MWFLREGSRDRMIARFSMSSESVRVALTERSLMHRVLNFLKNCGRLSLSFCQVHAWSSPRS